MAKDVSARVELDNDNNEVQEYDEAGVREVSLTMVNLTDYRDFEDYLKYLTGEKTV